jgi:hypothetical protein
MGKWIKQFPSSYSGACGGEGIFGHPEALFFEAVAISSLGFLLHKKLKKMRLPRRIKRSSQ